MCASAEDLSGQVSSGHCLSKSLMRQRRPPVGLTQPLTRLNRFQWSLSVLIETILTSRQYLYAACEARSISKATWIKKSTLPKAKKSLISASGEARVVSGCETTSAPHKAQPRSSRKAKGKAPIGAVSEAM